MKHPLEIDALQSIPILLYTMQNGEWMLPSIGDSLMLSPGALEIEKGGWSGTVATPIAPATVFRKRGGVLGVRFQPYSLSSLLSLMHV
jgi:hypothetical protein